MLTEHTKEDILANYPKNARMLLGPTLNREDLLPFIPEARKLWAPSIMVKNSAIADFAVKNKISWNSAYKCFCIVA